MWIYFLLLIICFVSYSAFRKRTALRISFICFALAASLRAWTVGIDTEQFYFMYETIGQSDWSFEGIRYEFLYCVFVKILYSISTSPQLLIVTTSIFINFAHYKFIKSNTSNYALATFLYMCTNVFFTNMNLMREAIAVSIILLAFSSLRRHKYVPYILASILAFLFHKTAIVAILILGVFLLCRYKHSKKILIAGGLLLFLGSSALFSLASGVLGGTYSEYADSVFGGGNNIGSIMEFGLFLLLFAVLLFGFGLGDNRRRTMGWEAGETSRFYQCLAIVILISLALVIRMNIFNRLSAFLMPFTIVIIAEGALRLKWRRIPNNRALINAACVVLFAYWLTIALLRPEWSGCTDYAFYWQAPAPPV